MHDAPTRVPYAPVARVGARGRAASCRRGRGLCLDPGGSCSPASSRLSSSVMVQPDPASWVRLKGHGRSAPAARPLAARAWSPPALRPLGRGLPILRNTFRGLRWLRRVRVPQVAVLGETKPRCDAHPPPVDEADCLGRVGPARGNENRPHADPQRSLGNPRRALPGAHRGERRLGEHKRAARCRQRGDRRPVSHQARGSTALTGVRCPRRVGDGLAGELIAGGE